MSAVLHSEVVRPSLPRWETPLLLAATAFLLLFTGLYAAWFGRDYVAPPLLDWQLSAYEDLHGPDQAIHAQLLTAAEEIQWMHFYSGTWPDIEDFQEIYLPPFYRDLAWERNGAIQWRQLGAGPAGLDTGLTLYHGSGGTLAGQGAWLLLIDHTHAGNEQLNVASIWYNAEADAPAPSQNGVPALVREGWQEVVPYRGSDETRRLRGGDNR